MTEDRECQKVPYPTEKAARRAQRYAARHGGPRGIAGAQPYHCQDCGRWHLGHRGPANDWRRRR